LTLSFAGRVCPINNVGHRSMYKTASKYEAGRLRRAAGIYKPRKKRKAPKATRGPMIKTNPDLPWVRCEKCHAWVQEIELHDRLGCRRAKPGSRKVSGGKAPKPRITATVPHTIADVAHIVQVQTMAQQSDEPNRRERDRAAAEGGRCCRAPRCRLS